MSKIDVTNAVEYHLQQLRDELLSQLSSGESTLDDITRVIVDVDLMWEFEDSLYELQNELDGSRG